MVINKTYGPVEFEAQKLDESATMVMGSELKIWTSMIEKPHGNSVAEFLNILHIHLNDMGDDATIDVVYLKRGETT